MKKFLAIIVTLCLLFCTIPGGFSTTALADEGTHTIVLSADKTSGGYSHSAALDGNTVEEFDYTWHADPGEAHNQVKNAPAEYYTGTKPDTDAVAYIAHDIFY